jgi:hypothetical protein
VTNAKTYPESSRTAGRTDTPTEVIFDSSIRKSTPESDGCAGVDGHKRRQGSKLHAPVDTLSELLALQITPADASDRAQGAEMSADIHAIIG